MLLSRPYKDDACDTVPHCIAQNCTAEHGLAQNCTAEHGTAQHLTAQHNAAQHSAAQHSTAAHDIWPSKAKHDMARPLCIFVHLSSRVRLSHQHPQMTACSCIWGMSCPPDIFSTSAHACSATTLACLQCHTEYLRSILKQNCISNWCPILCG